MWLFIYVSAKAAFLNFSLEVTPPHPILSA